MAKVFIGVGHGGSDPGAVANGFKEKNLNLAIAKACKAELEDFGVDVLMSRETDENDPLTDEIAECNAYAPDLAVEIHNNAGKGDGVEVYCTINGGEGRELAQNILKEIKEIGQNSRGVKTKKRSDGLDYYGFIRCTNCPACIVECAFVDNATDVQIIDTPAEQTAMGKAIAQGVLTKLGIYEKPKAEPEKSSTLYRVQVGAYASRANAEKMLAKLIGLGVSGFIVETEGNTHETETPPTKPIKSLDDFARDVIAGKYGNGAARKAAVEADGGNYAEVQKRVNEILSK